MLKFIKKINPLAVLTLVLSFGLMSGSFAQRSALASRLDTVPAIQVNGLDAHIGKYIHALYAVGQLGFIDLSRNPELFVIRPQSQGLQITSGSMVIPSVQIEKTPGRGSYNMIVFVLSSSAQIKWENYSQNPNPTSYKYLGLIFKSEVDQFVSVNGEAKVIQVSY